MRKPGREAGDWIDASFAVAGAASEAARQPFGFFGFFCLGGRLAVWSKPLAIKAAAASRSASTGSGART